MLIYFTIVILFLLDIYRSLYPQKFKLLANIFNNYKNEITEYYKPKLITLSYNVIYCYSYIQIKYNKFNVFIMPFINILCVSISNFLKKNNLIHFSEPNPKLVFEIYGKGVNIKNIFLDENNKNQIYNLFNEDLKLYNNYDFIILSDQTNISSNKIHYYNFNNITNDTIDSINYKVSNIKFISMDLTYNTKTYPIELQNRLYNHYIVNNKLNSEFYQYYLRNILHVPIEIENNNFDYNVQIIDHNVNIFDLSSRQELIIKENDYEIININNTEIKEQNIKQNVEQNIINNNLNTSEITEETICVNDSDSSNDYIKLEFSNK